MSIHNLDQIFKPQRIALFGVTPNPNSVSGKVLSNLVNGGFRGVVYPINGNSEAVLGIPCYPDLKDLPKLPDLGIICNPASDVPEVVRRCGEVGIHGLIIISAGFGEVGSEGKVLEDRIKFEMQQFDGMRIFGPNCLGIIAPNLNLNASFASGMPQKGHIAFISQSGALCSSVLDWAHEEKIGFSYFVSIGNTIDVDFGDLIDYFGEDEGTRSIILYIESITSARKFMTAARAFARSKPIIVYKAGRFTQSAEVASSHTGALATEDAVYDAAFQRIGIVRVLDIGEIFDCVELIGRQKIPKGPRLGIVTNAGGPGVMAVDALVESRGILAELSNESILRLNEYLPTAWSHRNPVDVLGDARSKRILKATRIVLEDPGVDAVLVILTPQAMTNPETTARSIGQLKDTTSKPILGVWLGGRRMRDGIRILTESGIAVYRTPEQAVHAFMTLVDYARNLESLYETPKDVSVEFSLDRKKLRSQFEVLLSNGQTILTEETSKAPLNAYGIPVTQVYSAKHVDEAIKIAEQIGYPIVMKIHSPEITHKTDVGGVALNLMNEAAVRTAYRQILSSVRDKNPSANIKGMLVQSMVNHDYGIELILGTKKDPVFGTVIMVGAGGITAELADDQTLGFPLLNERLAKHMLESLKIWPLLQGYRGRPPLNVDKIVEILIRLSYLAADIPEIKELDINPLLVTPNDIIALDARVILDTTPIDQETKTYEHLALRPYPEEYVQSKRLLDDTRVVLRPIKPEDETMWFELLRNCSRESIYMRFRYAFHWESHDVASRYCFIDYDREMAIVAEILKDEKRELLGVGRVIADPDHDSCEYAILVADAWQNKGLGSLLTDYCLEIAADWGLRRFVAQTTKDNPRMISVFRERGFNIQIDPSSSLVEVEKHLC